MDEHEQHSVHATPDDTPQRHRFRPIMVFGVIGLIALIIGGSIFTFTRLTGTGGLLGLAPAPTLTPGSNVFYFSESPTWGTIAVDGHVLHPLPTPGSKIPPLVLSSGTHDVVWQAAPFPTVHCILFLPFRYSAQNCPLSDPIVIRQQTRNVTTQLLSFSASLSQLSTGQFNVLYSAVQNIFDSGPKTTTLEPGEHYLYTSPTNNVEGLSTIVTASNPLLATIHFQTNVSFQEAESSGAFSPCVDGGLIDQQESCTNGGQSCYTFCSFTDTSAKHAPGSWNVLMPVSVEWNYSRTNGKALAQYQPDPSDRQGEVFLVALAVKWTGSGWQVSLYHSKTVDQSTIGNPACDAAAYIIGQDARFQSVAGSNQNIYWKYVSGSNAAAGCVAEAFLETPAGTASSSKPVASCLYRFGVPLALDSEAHRSWPFLLQASSYEQGIAQQIVAQSTTP